MAYTKKVWVTGEKILIGDLNNIEDEIDGIADLNYTFTGQKIFSGKVTVQNELWVTAPYPKMFMNDQAAGGKNLYLYNTGGQIHIYESGIGYHIRDIAGHTHQGGTDGAQIGHSYLNGVTGDQHHDEDHAATHAFGGTDGLTGGTPVDIGGANAEGAGTTFARNDHVHKHPVYTSGDMHQDYLLEDGSRDLTGDMVVDEGKKIDNVDLSDYDHRQYSLLHDEFCGAALDTFKWNDASVGAGQLLLQQQTLAVESGGTGNEGVLDQNGLNPWDTHTSSRVEDVVLEAYVKGIDTTPTNFMFGFYYNATNYMVAQCNNAVHGNTNIWLVCNSGGTISKVDTGIAFAGSNIRLRVSVVDINSTTKVRLHIDDVQEAEITTNIHTFDQDIYVLYETTVGGNSTELAYIRCVQKWISETLKY